MSDNSTLPATGDIVEDLDTFAVSGVHSKRQVVTLSPRDLSSGDSIGALTESAPASDTASSGLNGRLQRIAQRLTSILAAFLPTATANGATRSRINAAASTNATSLKASAGQAYSIDVFNVAAYPVYLKLYNKASAPTVGTDTPIATIPVPAGGGYSREYKIRLGIFNRHCLRDHQAAGR
jgi:hypothetical protein